MMPPIFEEDLSHVLQGVSSWDDLRGARLFITGGTGFFGGWLLETFCHANRTLQLQAQATVLTRDAERFLVKMPHLQNCEELRFIEGDVRTFDVDISGECTHIIHAATASGIEGQSLTPLETFDTIVGGTRRVLDFAALRGAGRFLQVSSGAVYGVQPHELSHVSEEYSGGPNYLDARSAYGEGKRAAEWLCAAYGEKYGLSFSSARCFAFVGPHLPLDAHFAVGNFLRDALQGGPLKINGDGTPLRSYLYAADLAIWLWEILLRGESGRAYNVGSERAVSILETAQAVAEVFDPRPEIIVARQSASGILPPRYVPDTGRARSELGLQPVIELKEALQRTKLWNS